MKLIIDISEKTYKEIRLYGLFLDPTCRLDLETALKKAKELNIADPKKGKWIVWGGMDVPENHGRHKCSECREFALLRYEKPLRKEVLSDFCPNCGAKMEADE